MNKLIDRVSEHQKLNDAHIRTSIVVVVANEDEQKQDHMCVDEMSDSIVS